MRIEYEITINSAVNMKRFVN